jgi:hypothetical protein
MNGGRLIDAQPTSRSRRALVPSSKRLPFGSESTGQICCKGCRGWRCLRTIFPIDAFDVVAPLP